MRSNDQLTTLEWTCRQFLFEKVEDWDIEMEEVVVAMESVLREIRESYLPVKKGPE